MPMEEEPQEPQEPLKPQELLDQQVREPEPQPFIVSVTARRSNCARASVFIPCSQKRPEQLHALLGKCFIFFLS